MRRLVPAMLAVAILVPACSGSGSGSVQSGASATPSTSASQPAQPAAHNAADTAFAQNMIPHHQQAVDMAMTVLNKGADEKVHALAQRIALAQQPEIELMTGWLKAWGEPTMSAGHDMAAMPGMMSDEQMRRFQAASGAALDRMFLSMMIEHHQGAVTMAETELRDGLNAEAKQLAQRIKDSQTKEIAEMRALLR